MRKKKIFPEFNILSSNGVMTRLLEWNLVCYFKYVR